MPRVLRARRAGRGTKAKVDVVVVKDRMTGNAAAKVMPKVNKSNLQTFVADYGQGCATFYSDKKLQANRKSWVRVIITYFAAVYIFVGSSLLIVFFCDKTEAVNIFQSSLPISTGIVTYWFAERARGKKPDSDE